MVREMIVDYSNLSRILEEIGKTRHFMVAMRMVFITAKAWLSVLAIAICKNTLLIQL